MINIDDEGDQNKKQKLSNSVVTTTTDDGDDDYLTYVRVIPTAEEKLPCHTEECLKDAAVSSAFNSNTNRIRNFCEGCQVIKRGGWPDGVVPIKYSADSNGDGNTQVDDAANDEDKIAVVQPAAAHSSNSNDRYQQYNRFQR